MTNVNRGDLKTEKVFNFTKYLRKGNNICDPDVCVESVLIHDH